MNIAVIGGGASGMMASIMLAKNGHNVTLFEKNNMLGKKLLITGKGRCNVTNNTTGTEFLNNIVRGSQFLRSAENSFNSSDTIEFFKALGVELKVERGNRVFPVSDKAVTILNALIHALKENNVNVKLNSKITAIEINGDNAIGVILNNYLYNFDAIIVATGGLSYSGTGSTGDGYNFAKLAGHTIIDLKPALNGIEIAGNECAKLEGLSLKNVKIYAYNENNAVFESEIGEMLFTNVGISGPLVLTMSSYINRKNVQKIIIDFKPALSMEQLHKRIDRIIEDNSTKQFSSLLGQLLPKRLIQIFAKRLNIQLNTKINQLTRNERQRLIDLLKHFELIFKCIEPIETSVITSGGVNLKEINPKDMSSKIIKNLFFIGEVLDIDALTGGFNLQIAFSTAVSCANSNYFKGEK